MHCQAIRGILSLVSRVWGAFSHSRHVRLEANTVIRRVNVPGNPPNPESTPVDMLDNSGNLISYPEYVGSEAFVMHATGSAY
jgi:hypothetical protein